MADCKFRSIEGLCKIDKDHCGYEENSEDCFDFSPDNPEPWTAEDEADLKLHSQREG